MTRLRGAWTSAACWPDGVRPSGEWQPPRMGPESQSPTSRLAMLAQMRMPALRDQLALAETTDLMASSTPTAMRKPGPFGLKL